MTTTGYLGNPNLKRAGEQIRYSRDQIEEYMKCKEDVRYFAENYMKIISLDKGLINIPLYDYQKNMLDSLEKHRFVILLAARQSGKTTSLTVNILHYILFNEFKTCAILANKAATAREILGRVQLAYEKLPKWLQQGVLEWNKGSMKLENGSRAICAASSGTAIRGMSIDYLLVDECISGDSLIDVRDKETKTEKTISIKDLYAELIGNDNIKIVSEKDIDMLISVEPK